MPKFAVTIEDEITLHRRVTVVVEADHAPEATGKALKLADAAMADSGPEEERIDAKPCVVTRCFRVHG